MVGGKRESRLSLLPSRLTALVKSTFVAPECIAEVQAAFQKRRAVVLRGADGYGKRGLAIHLLIESCPGRLFQVDHSAELNRLREWIEADDGGQRRVAPGAGFILDNPLDAVHLQGSVLQSLEEALERAGARLVLTTGPGTAVADELHDYIVDVTSGPDCLKLVEGHLRHHLGSAAAAPLLGREDIRKLVDQELGLSAACRHAADLASAVADEARGAEDAGEIDVERIRAVLARRGAETFDTWFSRLGDTQSRCFAVALAVWNRSHYDTVAKAARALYRRFDTRPTMVLAAAREPLPDGERPFLFSRQDWRHRLQARITRNEIKGLYGKIHAEIIEYTDETYPRRVIERAWSDYQAQDTILEWLAEMAEDNSEQ
jgi:hypothetical protein